VLNNLRDFEVKLVIKDGRLVARDGRCLVNAPSASIAFTNTVHLAPLDEAAFELRLNADTCPVIAIVPEQIVTRRETAQVKRQDRRWIFDASNDVVLIASIERHKATGKIGVGLVKGFGFRRHGAIGSSVAHDSHNLIVAGTNPKDMLTCVKALAESGGGWVAATDGEARALLPLPFAGLMSTAGVAEVCRELDQLHAVTKALSCPLPYPFGTLSFLALPVIPELRITDRGLFDVTRQEFVALG
jgi:adenine deaminase